MKLRLLQRKDAAGMLEWMHDDEINKNFRFYAKEMTEEKAQKFIEDSHIDAAHKRNIHLAIADENDEYLGTISLKNIDWEAKTAEYAISLRRMAQGKGIALDATQELIQYAFCTLGLNRIYLNVLPANQRAVHLYEKCGFQYEGTFRNHICIRGKIVSLKWYGLLKEEYLFARKSTLRIEKIKII